MTMTILFLQFLLCLMMGLHDWVHLPPLTDIVALKKHHSLAWRLWGSVVNFVMAFVPLALVAGFEYYGFSSLVLWIALAFYAILLFGAFMAWWRAYLFGCTAAYKAGFVEYANTHHFLPARGDNLVPNTFHCLLHAVLVTSLLAVIILLWRC